VFLPLSQILIIILYPLLVFQIYDFTSEKNGEVVCLYLLCDVNGVKYDIKGQKCHSNFTSIVSLSL
jgi:hypothetical protein